VCVDDDDDDDDRLFQMEDTRAVCTGQW